MAQLQIPCPSCRSPLNVNDTLAGKPIKCPACSHPFVVNPSAQAGTAESESASAPVAPVASVAPVPARPAQPEDELALIEPAPSEGGAPPDPAALENCPYCGVAWKKGAFDCRKCGYSAITQRRMHKIKTRRARFSLDTTKIFAYVAVIGVVFGIYWVGTNLDWLKRRSSELHDSASRATPTEDDGAAMIRKDTAAKNAGKVGD